MDCNSAVLGNIMAIAKRIINLIWILGPILAICSLVFYIVKLARDPDDKKTPKNIANSAKALLLLFFIPTIVNALMLMLGNRFNFSACWNSDYAINNYSSYIDPNSGGKKSKVIGNPDDYEKGVPSNRGVGAGEANSINDKTDYANKSLNVVNAINTNVNNSGRKYRAVQAACFTGRHVVYAQNRNYGSYKNSNYGGRICWASLETGEQIKCVEVGAEGGHMDGLAYDNDRGYVLKTSTKNRLLLYDNVTMEYKGYSDINSIHVGITYIPSIHMLVGYSGGSLIFYKYNLNNNKYERQTAVQLENFTARSVQGLGTDGTNIFIADSHPESGYRYLYTYSLTGKKLETHSFGSGFGSVSSEVEAAFADNNGVLYLACPQGIVRVTNYVANKIGLRS